ncbi:MAG: serine protease spb1 [Bdellovibrionota bacterium]
MKNFILAFTLLIQPLTACAKADYVSQDKPVSPSSAYQVIFKKLGIYAEIEWANPPQKSQDSKFHLKVLGMVSEESMQKLESATLEVILWMPSMGHGSSPTSVQKVNSSTFDVSNVYFIMDGDWEIRFVLKNGSQVLDEATYSLDI